MMQIVILNENPGEVALIEESVLQFDESFEVSSFDSIETFEQNFNHFHDYTIFILDLQLDNQSTIHEAREINQRFKGAQIIYISNDIKYLSDIYQTSHCFYINIKELETYLPLALKKATNLIRNSQNNIKITIRNKMIIIALNEIKYFERDLRRTIIHLRNKNYYTYENFKTYLQKIPDNFFECHRSFIVNFNEVQQYQRNRFILKDGTVIPISRSHEKKAKEAFGSYLKYQNKES